MFGVDRQMDLQLAHQTRFTVVLLFSVDTQRGSAAQQ